MSEKILVIGYGNSLRRDDGIGPHLARTIAGWQLPGVEALAVHALVPELADRLAQATRVLFIDAGPERTQIEVVPVGPAREVPASFHAGDPASLLGLTRIVYGVCPAAWLLVVPGDDFEFGEEMSPAAWAGVAEGLRWVKAWLSVPADRGEGTPRPGCESS